VRYISFRFILKYIPLAIIKKRERKEIVRPRIGHIVEKKRPRVGHIVEVSKRKSKNDCQS